MIPPDPQDRYKSPLELAPKSEFASLGGFQKLLAFLVGLCLVIGGIVDTCPRIGAIAIGLLLMGIFTVPQAIGVMRGKGTK